MLFWYNAQQLLTIHVKKFDEGIWDKLLCALLYLKYMIGLTLNLEVENLNMVHEWVDRFFLSEPIHKEPYRWVNEKGVG